MALNIPLRVVQGLLAEGFALSGAMKLARSREQLRERLPWAEDFSNSTVRLIATAELLGAIGLVLPPLLGIAPWLAAVAATGLATVMVLAALTHVRRKEPVGIVMTSLLGAVAVFIAWGRFGPEPY
jgi:uncharacterized membrane protein